MPVVSLELAIVGSSIGVVDAEDTAVKDEDAVDGLAAKCSRIPPPDCSCIFTNSQWCLPFTILFKAEVPIVFISIAFPLQNLHSTIFTFLGSFAIHLENLGSCNHNSLKQQFGIINSIVCPPLKMLTCYFLSTSCNKSSLLY